MKVRYAIQVLSATVAADPQKLILISSILNDALVTVDFIQKMNDLFDMFNLSHLFMLQDTDKLLLMRIIKLNSFYK
jgi:hypothetical protein